MLDEKQVWQLVGEERERKESGKCHWIGLRFYTGQREGERERERQNNSFMGAIS